MTRELIIECMTCKEECEEEDSCFECAENQLAEYEYQIKAEVIDDFQEWLKTQVVGIDNKTKEILVVREDRWELAIDEYKKQLKEQKNG